MPGTADSVPPGPEAVFLAQLPTIDRILAVIARRHALDAAEGEEFGAWARARLIEDEYAVFRKFGSRSSLATYLTVVIANLFRDYRNANWGRWRPSAVARRLGPIALRLETLVYRDGYAPREAVAMLRSRGVAETESGLRRLLARMPARPVSKAVSLDSIAEAAPQSADSSLWAAEATRVREATETILHRLLETLPSEDQVIVRMHFWDGVSIADIARTLHTEQRPLYRRLEAIRALLKNGLEQSGIGRSQVADVLDPETAT